MGLFDFGNAQMAPQQSGLFGYAAPVDPSSARIMDLLGPQSYGQGVLFAPQIPPQPPIPPDPTQASNAFPYSRNRQYIAPNVQSSYNTQLSPEEEAAFRQWGQANRVPFNPNIGVSDYDMRGFYRGLMNGDPHAQTGMNANDGQLHYSDWWKTPFHHSFSNASQWATQDAPRWNNQDQLIDKNGNVIFDERAQR